MRCKIDRRRAYAACARVGYSREVRRAKKIQIYGPRMEAAIRWKVGERDERLRCRCPTFRAHRCHEKTGYGDDRAAPRRRRARLLSLNSLPARRHGSRRRGSRPAAVGAGAVVVSSSVALKRCCARARYMPRQVLLPCRRRGAARRASLPATYGGNSRQIRWWSAGGAAARRRAAPSSPSA